MHTYIFTHTQNTHLCLHATSGDSVRQQKQPIQYFFTKKKTEPYIHSKQSPIYTQKSPIYNRKSPTSTQKRALFTLQRELAKEREGKKKHAKYTYTSARSHVHTHLRLHITAGDIQQDTHTTTYCNTLQQHTATHCNNILQHIATTYCNTLQQHSATHCHTLHITAGELQQDTHTTTYCNTLQQHTATTYCNTLQHTAYHGRRPYQNAATANAQEYFHSKKSPMYTQKSPIDKPASACHGWRRCL